LDELPLLGEWLLMREWLLLLLVNCVYVEATYERAVLDVAAGAPAAAAADPVAGTVAGVF
jgi:hypothetical protein